MKHPLQILLAHLHILVISVLIAGLGIGILASPISVKSPVAATQKPQNFVQLPTSPVAGDSHESSISATSTPVEASGAPQTAQNEPDPSISSSPSVPSPLATPVVTSPGAICVTCPAVSGCTDSCPSPEPEPAPTPVCAPCGGSFTPGSYPQHIMCPMYCAYPVR